MPLENGEHNGHLTIISNDVDEPQIVVPVLGSSIAPPIISVNPSSLSSNLLTGETERSSLRFQQWKHPFRLVYLNRLCI